MLGLVATAIITGISLLERRSKASQKPAKAPKELAAPSAPPQPVSWLENSPKRVVRASLNKDRPTPPPEFLKALVHYPSTPEQLHRAVQSEKLTLLRYNLRRFRGESG
jgi:hypothetical protein